MSVVIGPAEGYAAIVDKGEQLTLTDRLKVFTLSVYAGCFIGFGALVALTVGGNIDKMVAANGSGVQTFVYAALFPVNLLFVLLSGAVLYTGATFTTPAAYIEGRARLPRVVAVIVISLIGNLVGGIIFAIFTEICGLNEGGVAQYAIRLLVKKTVKKSFGVVVLQGIGCNWLVCMAVFLCTMAQDMTGKYVGIWFPISTFVACGFEHYPANCYLLSLGWIAARKDPLSHTLPGAGDVFGRNFVPSALGNLIAGVFIMACGYSYFFGRLRTCPCCRRAFLRGKVEGPALDAAAEPPEVADFPDLVAVQEFKRGISGASNSQGKDSADRPAPAPTPQNASWLPAIMESNGGFARTISA